MSPREENMPNTDLPRISPRTLLRLCRLPRRSVLDGIARAFTLYGGEGTLFADEDLGVEFVTEEVGG